MTDLLDIVTNGIDALSAIELTATVLGIAYLLLAIRESIWCWACALAASLLFAWLFVTSRLYMDAGLQIFYAVMAVYGWWRWRHGDRGASTLAVSRWPAGRHAVALAAAAAATAISGALLSNFTDAAYPYVDSATTWASLWATFLVAQKVLENWWYWLVIDAVSIGIYLERGLEFAALLFAVYVVLVPFGYLSWRRSLESAQSAPAAAVKAET